MINYPFKYKNCLLNSGKPVTKTKMSATGTVQSQSDPNVWVDSDGNT